MGTTFASINPVQAPAHTIVAIRQHQAVYDARLRDCPLHRTRRLWVKQDPAGSTSGGGGLGTLASPYLIRNWADFIALFNSDAQTNTEWSFQANSPTNPCYMGSSDTLTVARAGITLNLWDESEGDPTAAFWVSSFQREDIVQAGGWGLASGVYSKTFVGVGDIGGIREDATLLNLPNGTEIVYTIYDSLANLQASPANTYGMFFINSAGNTSCWVKRNGSSPAGAVQLCRGTTNIGIKVNQVDGFRRDRINISGAALQNASNAYQAMVYDVVGTQAALSTNCADYYSGSGHIVIQVSGTAGGLPSDFNCRGGLCRYQPGPALWAYYNSAGSQEAYNWNCRADYVAVPENTRIGRQGRIGYAHCDDSIPSYVRMVVFWGSVSVNTTYGAANNCAINSLPIPSNHCATEELRGFIIGEDFQGGNDTDLGWGEQNTLGARAQVQRIGCSIKTRRPSTVGAANYIYPATGVSAWAPINCYIEVDWNNVTSGGLMRWYGSLSAGTLATWQSCFIKELNKPGDFHSYEPVDSSNSNLLKTRMFSCIWSADATVQQGEINHVVNQTPSYNKSDSPTPGAHALAVYKSGTTFNINNTGSPPAAGAYWGFGATPKAINLTSVPTFGLPAVTGPFFHAGWSPSPMAPEYDFYLRRRDLRKPSYGPVEHPAPVFNQRSCRARPRRGWRVR